MSETSRSRLVAPLAVVTVLAALVAGLGGFFVGRNSVAPPAESSADVGFVRDMYEHHGQAVEMSLIFREKTQNTTLRAIAYDIATSQGNQMGQMEGILKVWGYPMTRTGAPMAWMSGEDAQGGHTHSSGGHVQPNGMMAGMASAEQLQQLRGASGVAAEKLFLQLMITHHKAGIEMAKAGSELADTDYVKTLATKMHAGQTAETALLESELAKLG
ncbi:DUF305 domain-containing protein [Propionibacteriaceae bacterium G1746]